jgi:hypothetical protein
MRANRRSDSGLGTAAQSLRRRAVLSVEQILAWVDEHHSRTGRWPNSRSGAVAGQPGERWATLNNALRLGRRGLPGGDSLARLLQVHRSVRNRRVPPTLNERLVLKWAHAHRRRTGSWPNEDTGPVTDAPGERWGNVNASLRHGYRGLPGGESLARLLVRRAGARTSANIPNLSVWMIVRWAEGHRRMTGRWPTQYSGPVLAAPGERWSRVDDTLRRGTRGLPGGSSLARLLGEYCGLRNLSHPPPLSEKLIRQWAKAHQARTGRWPGTTAGAIPEAPGETWCAVGAALRDGRRGLRGGRSLATFLGRRGTGSRHDGATARGGR